MADINWSAVTSALTTYVVDADKSAATALTTQIDIATKAWRILEPAWTECLADRTKANAKAKASVSSFQEWMVNHAPSGHKWTADERNVRKVAAIRHHSTTARGVFPKWVANDPKRRHVDIDDYVTFLERYGRGDITPGGNDSKGVKDRRTSAETSRNKRAAIVLESTNAFNPAAVVVGKQFKAGHRELLIILQNVQAAIFNAASKLTKDEVEANELEVRQLVSKAVEKADTKS